MKVEDSDHFNQILIDYCKSETSMTPAEQKACDDRHEAEERLRLEQAKVVDINVASSVKAVESKIRIWVLTIGLTVLLTSVAAMVGSFIKIGIAQERIDQNTTQHEKYDVRQERLEQKYQELQKKLDQIEWGLAHGGAP